MNPNKTMDLFDHELRYIQAAVSQLENYLLSDDLYRPIGVTSGYGEKPYPALTIGNLLIAEIRAKGFEKSSAEGKKLRQVQAQLDRIRTQWSAAWQVKVKQEMRARVELWANFLDDYREKSETNFDRYPYEVGRRVMIQILSAQDDAVSSQLSALIQGLDRYLKSVIREDDFLWDPPLQSVFPRDPYWYLYGQLPK